ncbi:class I SAM-dependent methyltransferase [Marispirochaeta sp.]|uniref:class I SAM-dependent methyltransferase n=1 Tax=Marispirochaeta sp. TaxID=2038653 RepID=UPI0029C9B092|nr:class I SAM-dependent methyltransferase [Marispirochaeta sp.]
MDFYTSLSYYYDLLFPPSQEQKSWALDFSGPGPVLDAGCGTGELLLHLTGKGIPGFGFDADKEMIRRAKKKTVAAESNADFRKAGLTDASVLYQGRFFTAIFCMGNTIAHVHDLQELNTVIADFASLLSSGHKGRLAVQLLNYDRILRQKPQELPPLTAEEKDLKLRFLRRYRYEEEHILFTGALKAESSKNPAKNLESSFETILLPIRRQAITRAFSEAGLRNVGIWEDYGKTPAGEESAVFLVTGES